MRRILPVVVLAILFNVKAIAALNGTYTINNTITASASNYLTFASAVSDMVSGTRADGGTPNGPAVSGPVVFNVATATFTEKVSIPAIVGASAINTITFNGAGPLLSLITFNSTTANDYTIQLNGADYIRIQNMGVHNTGISYGYGVQLLNNADNNIITGCNITTPLTSTSYYHSGIIAGTYYTNLANNATNLTITNNTIAGGRFSIIVNGTSATPSAGLLVSGNTCTENYFSALYLQYLHQPQIIGNNITLRANYTGSYGSQMRYCRELVFERNKVLNAGFYGAYFIGINQSWTNYSTISNNMIGGGFQATGTAYGMYFTSSGYLRMYHNSILVDNPGTTARALYMTGITSNVEILNNALAADASNGTGAMAAYITPVAAVTAMNHNMYFSNGTSLVYLSATYNTLAALQAGQPSFNQNSQAGWPNYVSSSDLHTFGIPLANWGTLTSVVTDFDQQARPFAPELTPDVGADEFLLPAVDPDPLQITSPTVAAIGANTVAVAVQNNGGQSLNGQNITMEFSTNGGVSWMGAETFTVTSMATAGSQQTFTFSTPWIVSGPGTYNLCVRFNPNPTGDPDGVNQVCLSVCTGLAGTYTINNTIATGGTNFNNFSDASAALGGCGISAPVTFNVAPGNYVGNFTIGAITGSSAVNTVTFDGANSSLVNLNFNSSTLNSSLVKLDGADWVTFKNMTLEILGIYGFCFHLTNQANNNTIEDCRLLMDSLTTSVYQIGVVASGSTYSGLGDCANNTTIRNNYIRGGYYGIRLNGTSTTVYCTNNKVLDNEIDNYYYYGIYSIYQKAPQYNGNDISMRITGTVATSGYGIYVNIADSSFSISGNRIPFSGAYGVYITGGNRNNTGKGRVSNNMVGSGFQTTGTAYALYMTSSRDCDIVHNSLHTGGFSGNALYLVGTAPTSDSMRILNNILSSGIAYIGGGGVPLRVSSASAVQQLNYNLYYTGAGTVADYQGTQFPSLASFQASYPALNANSAFGVPGFVAETDLHIVCSDYDNAGTPVGTLQDIDQQSRSLTAPDLGADEFNGITISMSLGPDTTHCGRLVITADTNTYNYFFWDGIQSGPTVNVDSSAVHHLIVVDSNNCRASDTIAVTIFDYPVLVYEGDTISQCSFDTLDAGNPGSSFLWSTGDTTAIIYPTSAGVYTVDITTADGCAASDTVTISIFPPAAASLGADTTFCNGGGHVLDAGAGATGTVYQWNTGAQTQVVLVSAAGWYSVTVTTINGCYAQDSVFMNVLQPPVVNLGPNRFECDQFTLDAGMGGTSYVWSTGSSSQTISSNVSGSYAVTVTSANGCQTIDQVQINVGTTPIVNLGPDPVVCDGSTATLNAGHPGFNYLWSTGQTTQTIAVGTAGTYLVNVIDPVSQCTGSDTIEVIQSNLNIELGPNFALCQGDQGVLDAGSGATSYLWNTGDMSQILLVNQAGTYSVQITDVLGCIAHDTISVNLLNRPVAAFTGPSSIPLLQPAQFTDNSGAGITTWHWDFGDGQISNQQNPTYTYQAMGTFNVCLTAGNGTCDSTVCMQIVVGPPVEIEDEYLAGYTTVFPNPGDGHFSVGFDLPAALDLELEVYSLAGQRLYARTLNAVRARTESIDLSMQPDGVYFLRIRSSKGHLQVTKLIKE